MSSAEQCRNLDLRLPVQRGPVAWMEGPSQSVPGPLIESLWSALE